MNNNDLSRISKKVVSYFWDPLPRNDDSSTIWCLGRSYDSRFKENVSEARQTGTSPSAQSESDQSHADSAIVTHSDISTKQQPVGAEKHEVQNKSQTDLTRSEEEALGWPPEFLDDLESRLWLTYRNNFSLIEKSSDPAATSAMSFSTKLRNLGNHGGFSSDTGWGCMIRSGQSLLANTILTLQLGRNWRKGMKEEEHKNILALFADDPQAPFSVHKFVDHGAQACGKHPGEWALTNKHPDAGLRVYARPDDGDVYVDSLLTTASAKDADDNFQPTLIVLGVRLGIDRITPIYHAALTAALELPQSVGIAGGRPSSSHYFIGHQADQFFYLDPHFTRSMLPLDPSSEDIETCHTRRVRRLRLTEMDPSMLLGFLVHSKQDFDEWRAAVEAIPGKAILHVHDKEPTYATGIERPGAVDEVETWDETGDEEN
nr:putative cysteine protease atg4 [Quercus suber]